MLTKAHAYGHAQSPEVLATPHAEPRGNLHHAVRAADLVQFGRCPWRWVAAPEPEDLLAANGPSLTEWMVAAPGLVERYFARRPETYEAMKLLCPKCNSEGPAKVCTKCGQRRRNVVVPRPWTSAAKHCAQWVQQREQEKRRIVAPGEWDRAKSGADTICHDEVVAALLPGCDRFFVMDGVWQDQATGLEFPILETISLLPRSGSAMDHCVVNVVETRNADPSVWEAWAYQTGAHIRAALALDLFNATCDGMRVEHLWIVVEREQPRLVARRRASRELLAEGRKRLADLAGAYAQCLKLQRWPRFEPESGGGLGAWGPVDIQPWMTSGAGPHGGYFAPTAVFEPVPEPPAAQPSAAEVN